MPHVLYLTVIAVLIGFNAAALNANKPRNCSIVATNAHMDGYVQGMRRTRMLYDVTPID